MEKESRFSSWFRFLLPFAASAIFTLGVYSSQTESNKRELNNRIDSVHLSVQASLEAAVRLRGVQVDGIEKRVIALENMAKENTAINFAILQKLSVLETASQYQNKTLDEMRTELRTHGKNNIND